MAPSTYGEILASNVSAARGRIRISQASLAARMRALGFTQWVPQTVSKSERNARRMLAEEVPGLAVALETTIGRLMQPVDEDQAVEFQQGGPAVSVTSVRLSVVGRSVVGEVEWDGDKPVIAVPEYPATVQVDRSLDVDGRYPPRAGRG